MNDLDILNAPEIYTTIEAKSEEIGFTMPSDLLTGSLLKTLISSKPAANILELGTGTGLSLSWMIDGMDSNSRITTVDIDPELVSIVRAHFDNDKRVHIVCEDGAKWIKEYRSEKFDVVFADAWPGKYSEIVEILDLIKIGGLYIIDDMSSQPNWPAGHQKHVDELIRYLEQRNDFNITKLNWSTGLIIAARKS